ncbi:hypothetical protein [Sansalvadorimonas verongulae]|uniref:hypothetical protein n=1 Tax=Sansalvadorimonas verongulae TaxID=2172824 RepID=UPI0012BB776E|nr:hypothetical protein [Sansalvadorimonas verongulae]MTI11556.1 hypothetical protein [Sansalvadorimonas verongulae]
MSLTMEQRKALAEAFAALAGQATNYRQRSADAKLSGYHVAAERFSGMAEESKQNGLVIAAMIREAR